MWKKKRCPNCGKSFLKGEYWNHYFKCKVRKQKKKDLESIFDIFKPKEESK